MKIIKYFWTKTIPPSLNTNVSKNMSKKLSLKFRQFLSGKLKSYSFIMLNIHSIQNGAQKVIYKDKTLFIYVQGINTILVYVVFLSSNVFIAKFLTFLEIISRSF